MSPRLFSNGPSMYALNHTPIDTRTQWLFSSPAGHEVETLLLLMAQWPVGSPDTDVEVMTKAEQLSFFILSLSASLFTSFLLCAASERVSRGHEMS